MRFHPLNVSLIVAAGLVASVTQAPTQPAHACGAFLSKNVDTAVGNDAQRVLIQWGLRDVSMHLEMGASGGDGGFVWLIPVKQVPELSLGDASIFDGLGDASSPNIALVDESPGGGGSLCGDAGALVGGSADNVFHMGGGTVGQYTWDAILSTDPEALTGWLVANDYPVPSDLTAYITPYVEQSVKFIAVKLTEGAKEQARLQPLVLTMPAPPDRQLGFPLGLSAMSSAETLPVLIYVLANTRFRISNYASIELPTVAAAIRERYDEGLEPNYADTLDAMTVAGGGRLVVTEFAGVVTAEQLGTDSAAAALLSDEHFYLTRMYARIPRAALADATITFANHAADVDNEVVAQGSGPANFSLAMLCLFGVVWIRRRDAERDLRDLG